MPDIKNERVQLEAIQKFYFQKNYSEALKLVEKLLGELPLSFQGKLYYTKILRALGRLSEAYQLLSDLDKQYPYNISVLTEMAGVLFTQNELQESLIFYNRILFLDSFNSEAKQRVDEIQKKIDSSFDAGLEETQVDKSVPSEERMAEAMEKAEAQAAPDRVEPPPPRRDAEPEVSLHLGDTGDFSPYEASAPAEAKKTPPPEPPDTHVLEQAAEDDVVIHITGEPEPVEELSSPLPEADEEQPTLEDELASQEKQPEEKPEIPFATESAAEIYQKQGLKKEAFAIYQELLAQTGDERFKKKMVELEQAAPVISPEKQRIITELQLLLKWVQSWEKRHV